MCDPGNSSMDGDVTTVAPQWPSARISQGETSPSKKSDILDLSQKENCEDWPRGSVTTAHESAPPHLSPPLSSMVVTSSPSHAIPTSCSMAATFEPRRTPDLLPLVPGELDPKAEVEEFLQKFSCLRAGGIVTRKDVSVKELRHIIPLLIMDIYGFKDEPAQKKVKGLWDQAPKDWPQNVPYLDPNNGQRGSQGKPRKDILIQMFHYLIMEYQRRRGPESSNMIRFCNSPEPMLGQPAVMKYPCATSTTTCSSNNTSAATTHRWPSLTSASSPTSSDSKASWSVAASSGGTSPRQLVGGGPRQQWPGSMSTQSCVSGSSGTLCGSSWDSPVSSVCSNKAGPPEGSAWSHYPGAVAAQEKYSNKTVSPGQMARSYPCYTSPGYQRQMPRPAGGSWPQQSSEPTCGGGGVPRQLSRGNKWNMAGSGYHPRPANVWPQILSAGSTCRSTDEYRAGSWMPQSSAMAPPTVGSTQTNQGSWFRQEDWGSQCISKGSYAPQQYRGTESHKQEQQDKEQSQSQSRSSHFSAAVNYSNTQLYNKYQDERTNSEHGAGGSPNRADSLASPSYHDLPQDDTGKSSPKPPPLIPIDELVTETSYPPTPPSSAPSPLHDQPQDLVIKPAKPDLGGTTCIKVELPEDDGDAVSDLSSRSRQAGQEDSSEHSLQNRKRTYSHREETETTSELPAKRVCHEGEEQDSRRRHSVDGGWNPHEESNIRLKQKLTWMEDNSFLAGGDMGLLSIIKDLLYKLGLLTDRHTEQFWLEKVHEFEGTLDIIKLWRSIPSAHRKKWNEFQSQWYVKIVTLHNRLSEKCEDEEEEEEHKDEQPVPLRSPTEAHQYQI